MCAEGNASALTINSSIKVKNCNNLSRWILTTLPLPFGHG